MRSRLPLLMLLVVVTGCARTAQQAPAATPPAVAVVEPPVYQPGRVPPPGPYARGFDALHYEISVVLPDTGSYIRGRTLIRIGATADRPDTLRLDLVGLAVTRARLGLNGDAVSDVAFRQGDGYLYLPVARTGHGDTLRVQIDYQGTPDNGLIIRDNVNGDRGAFADNWPDRARFWFPSIDHPSDKATVSYAVRAPRGWQVVANGERVGMPADQPVRADALTPLDGIWRWTMNEPIPTYTMVIGATRFAVGDVGCARARREHCIPVGWWAYEPDSTNAARIFAHAADMVAFYARLIAPFPYPRLANVQSSTLFGGMENAGAIFYSGEAIARGQLGEGTVAHEIAHQWFGDAVTPARWADVWLSEGFATYFGTLFSARDDASALTRAMQRTAQGYLRSKVTGLALADTLAVPENNLMSLLNANSYNKGAVVLHMLRGVLGDSAFFGGIRRYYREHAGGNATTNDLRLALEQQSGRELAWFFDQWAYRPGHPVLQESHEYDESAGEVVVRITQVQQSGWPVFRAPVEVDIIGADSVRVKTELAGRETVIRRKAQSAPSRVVIDPRGWLLHELKQ